MKYLKSKKKRTILRNIEKKDIQIYIKKIIKLNKDILLYKINYNEINKTLTIIANKRVQIKRIIRKNIIIFKTLKDLKDEFNSLLNQEKIIDEEYISLDSVKQFYNNIISALYDIKINLEHNMEEKIQYIYGKCADISIYNYDSTNNTIKIGFSKDYKNRKYKKIIFKNDDNISILKSEEKESNNILNLLNDDLKNLFNNYKRYKLLDKEYIERLKSVNSNLCVNISLYGITISSKYNDKIHFEIRYNTYDFNYYIKCDDEEILNYLKEIAPSLLKLIYIPIVECPTWSQDDLYDIRDNELDNPKKYKIKRYRKQ